MTKKVIIVGGGIAGLAMSLFLKRANIESVIYEQTTVYGKVGGHFVIHPSGIQVLKELGLGDALKKNSHQITDFKVMDKEGNPLFEDIEVDGEIEEMPYLINIARFHLIDILYQKAVEQGIEINFGKTLKSFIDDKEHIQVFFEDGTEAKGELLIGADGVRSRTRSSLFPFPNYPLKYAGKWGVYGMVDLDKLGEHKEFFASETSLMYFHENFNFFVSKHHPTDNEISWSMIVNEERKIPKKHFEEKSIEQFRSDLANRFSDWDAPIKHLIENTDNFIPKQLFRIDLMTQYSHGRVALIGDALHTADPNAGMGTTLGLEDALYLSKLLRDHDYEDAFYYYEIDRKDRAEKVFNSASILDNLNLENTDDYAFFGEGLNVSWD
ncbi:2-polyprenyl-6-methoxyphenol hydroxylase-like FAD-dependent oxidoreductase [Paenibacillus rhizosphaerae]|uniref:2-polyprenyl-6-methoxyphenol hydroxylase-like FAD-dependent oxidoreductase n=1 Tax=Paenibacillus rhizosphaerae TaxID=297318 RepID=A0A839U1J8_9BACL|nr:NAD(P)/FAD-dependent oxidoreductase [Paenibacillus rhizosphaerae]MBB3131329.1 2-polyprenyl-6-methoxyphenol hydroxylase-like FAD-dependent oxidoreductase [Paenibacillus rhizosphaerae]